MEWAKRQTAVTTEGDLNYQSDENGQNSNMEHKAHMQHPGNYRAVWAQIKNGTGWLEDIFM